MNALNDLLRGGTSARWLSLAALVALSGCSLVIDSGRYVAQTDAGPDDMGSDGDVDQGPVECNGVLCEPGWSCLDGLTCVECIVDNDCASGACDPASNTCVGTVSDCTSCAPTETCRTHPSDVGFVCLACDRDGDSFLSLWSACDVLSDGLPRDCDDLDAQRFPGSAPFCNDGFRQVCPSTELERLAGFLSSAELGRLPVHDISGDLAFAPQLTVMALDGNSVVGVPNSADEATGVFGFLTSGGEAVFHATSYGGYDAASQSHVWPGYRMEMNTRAGWPYEPGTIGAFALGYATNQIFVAVQGTSGGAPVLGVHSLDSNNDLFTYYSLNLVNGFVPPVAFRGREIADVFFRQNHPLLSEISALATVANGTTTDAHFIPNDPAILLDTESGFVITPTASGFTAEAWDGVATAPINVAQPTLDRLVGPPRFSRDVLQDRLIALLPYEAGVRVVLFNCTPGALDSCSPVATDIQTVLPNLQAFDFEIHGGFIILVQQVDGSQNGDLVVAHLLSLDENLVLTRENTAPISLINAADASPAITSVHALETDLDFGPHHVEVVVGAAVIIDGTNTHLLGTSLRACSTL